MGFNCFVIIVLAEERPVAVVDTGLWKVFIVELEAPDGDAIEKAHRPSDKTGRLARPLQLVPGLQKQNPANDVTALAGMAVLAG